eukprot:TRINITY_DN8336_c0_g1_i1.p1 TRINITY_DN8336_c0_g1~~TRINITY_DN8336_c0_g1_i1.p1  ORF type:complete len:298 (-),score=104.39 TRINITY_DN8336_c0_g1_i1:211-1104(-)
MDLQVKKPKEKREKTLEERERKVFSACLGLLQEDEDEESFLSTPDTLNGVPNALNSNSEDLEGVTELDVNQVNKKRDKDSLNGKVLPTMESTASFSFAGQKVLLKQDTHSCGGHLWRSATVLMTYLENKTVFPDKEDGISFWNGKKVIELGAGTGLLGIALAKIGAQVILTDQESLVPLMRENARLNGIQDQELLIEELWWGRGDCDKYTKDKPIDFIIASDCVYLEPTFAALTDTMHQLSNSETRIFMSFQKRRKADNRFWKIAQKKFKLIRIPFEEYSDTNKERVMINELKKIDK